MVKEGKKFPAPHISRNMVYTVGNRVREVNRSAACVTLKIWVSLRRWSGWGIRRNGME